MTETVQQIDYVINTLERLLGVVKGVEPEHKNINILKWEDFLSRKKIDRFYLCIHALKNKIPPEQIEWENLEDIIESGQQRKLRRLIINFKKTRMNVVAKSLTCETPLPNDHIVSQTSSETPNGIASQIATPEPRSTNEHIERLNLWNFKKCKSITLLRAISRESLVAQKGVDRVPRGVDAKNYGVKPRAFYSMKAKIKKQNERIAKGLLWKKRFPISNIPFTFIEKPDKR